MEIFWNTKHTNNESWWISSGISGEEILNTHKLNIHDLKNLDILDIGIGAGNLTKHLNANKCNVYSCDISKKALEKVKNFSKTYSTENLKNIPPVDIAICNLVFQHCDDSEVERIINDVNLKECGFFTFQFAYLRRDEEPSEYVKSNIKNKTHYFRSKQSVIEIISRSNKKLLQVLDDVHYYEIENFSWAIFRVSNK